MIADTYLLATPQTPFIHGACPRNDIITLLAEVRLLEDGLYEQ